jgi:transcriptional regulator with XRE-family HTH domain
MLVVYFNPMQDTDQSAIVDTMGGETIGHRMRRLRLGRASGRLSQEALARCAGISTQAVAALENGSTISPQPATLAALARCLETSEVYLFTGQDPVPDERQWQPAHLAVALRHTTHLTEEDIQEIIKIIRGLELQQDIEERESGG